MGCATQKSLSQHHGLSDGQSAIVWHSILSPDVVIGLFVVVVIGFFVVVVVVVQNSGPAPQ